MEFDVRTVLLTNLQTSPPLVADHRRRRVRAVTGCRYEGRARTRTTIAKVIRCAFWMLTDLSRFQQPRKPIVGAKDVIQEHYVYALKVITSPQTSSAPSKTINMAVLVFAALR